MCIRDSDRRGSPVHRRGPERPAPTCPGCRNTGNARSLGHGDSPYPNFSTMAFNPCRRGHRLSAEFLSL
eukprot:5788342-Lingulodinium_polyedra.AAC.1